ncbi:MAG: hypothetical protein Q4B67_00335 [Eubacteriales bacterium]|nr:hypothetical protein [Eubacteriales bacterium]
MNTFKVGFSRVNIDPPLGIAVHGYYVPRFASEILDSLTASAVAFSMGSAAKDAECWNPDTGRYVKNTDLGSNEENIVLISIDNCGLREGQCTEFRNYIALRTGLKAENVILQCTHTHTGPFTEESDMFDFDPEPVKEYANFLKVRLADAALAALRDLKPARMGFIVGRAPERVAYIRRYKMKDGTTWTCPPINDPNIVHPIGELDQRVNVLRFDREAGDTIVLVNYGLHADCLNLDKISADWPGVMRDVFETVVTDAKCVFFNGCEGDVGSTHVYPEGGDMNDTLISFDNEMKSVGMARFIGRTLAGTLLQVYDKAEYVDVDSIAVMHETVAIPANKPAPEDLPRAHKFKELHEAGRDCDIPYTAMELTTVVAEAIRMCNLENGPDEFMLDLTGLKIGPVAFVGIPGEPFTDIGRQIKTAEGWRCILPMCLTNGSEGYYPMKEAFDEGGYEARSSDFKGGVAERIIEGGKKLLDNLK